METLVARKALKNPAWAKSIKKLGDTPSAKDDSLQGAFT